MARPRPCRNEARGPQARIQDAKGSGDGPARRDSQGRGGGVDRAVEAAPRRIPRRVDPGARAEPLDAVVIPEEHPPSLDPYLGEHMVARLTGSAVDTWMRKLEESGRADGRGGLFARTVRYVYTLLRSALRDAVRQGRLPVNPTDRSTPPGPSQARPQTCVSRLPMPHLCRVTSDVRRETIVRRLAEPAWSRLCAAVNDLASAGCPPCRRRG